MEINKKPDPPQNRVKKIQKIRELFCRLISDGTVQEVETFLRYFQKDLENPVWPVLKGPFTKNVPIESVSNITNILDLYELISYQNRRSRSNLLERSSTSLYSLSRIEKKLKCFI
jgi:hypothetical protein